jgi:hypothetical protein
VTAPLDFGTSLQRLLMAAYKGTGASDESFVAYLRATLKAGSKGLVSGWRNGGDVMPLDALDALLDHAGADAGHILNVLCQRYGFRAVSETEATTERPVMLSRSDMLREVSEVLTAAAVGESDGRRDENDIDAELVEAREALEAVESHVARLVSEKRAMGGALRVHGAK